MPAWTRFKCDHSGSSGRWKTVENVLIVVNILISTCLPPLAVVLWMRKTQGLQKDRPCQNSASSFVSLKSDRRQYCFKESRGSCLERGYSVKIHNNLTLCCGNLGDHLYGVMSEELRERLESDAAKGRNMERIKGYISRLHSNSSAVQLRPAAHVGILKNGNNTGPDSEAPRIQWEQSGGVSFLSGGLVHGGDRLTVTEAGYYYVYTGLQFNVHPTEVESGAIVAYIYRHVNGTRASRRKLMMARESSCKTTRGGITGPVSVYMAGIFLLREKDEISIRTHSQSLLNRSPATTYMGMHMV